MSKLTHEGVSPQRALALARLGSPNTLKHKGGSSNIISSALVVLLARCWLVFMAETADGPSIFPPVVTYT